MPKPKTRSEVNAKAARKRRLPPKRKSGLKTAVEAGTPPMLERLQRLTLAISGVEAETQSSPRTARLLVSGVPKMAQKVIEEAGEVAIEAVRGDRLALIFESADLLYNLTVLWFGSGIDPQEVWAEMDRRQAMLGMAEKLPKAPDAQG